MLDGMMRGVIDAPLNRGGRWLAARGASANAVTLAGLALGLVAAALIWRLAGRGLLVALVLLASRLADGLDGAVARARGKTDFGGYLDIVCDFAFYGAIPLAFVLRDPAANGVAGAFLLFSFLRQCRDLPWLCDPGRKARAGDPQPGRKVAVFHRRAAGGDRDDPVLLSCSRCGPRSLRRWHGCSVRCAW